MSASIGPRLERWAAAAPIAAGAGIVISAIGYFLDAEQFARSYLLAFVYWIGLALSCLALLMLHNLVGGRWSFAIRRQLEAASRTLPLFVILFVPLALSVGLLYEWAHPEAVAGDGVLQHKAPYLNSTGFVLRAGLYFLIWIVMATLLNRWSARQEAGGAGGTVKRMNALSGPGIVIYFVTVTLACIDWMMSLEPHWFSTVYGLIYIIGEALLALSFIVVVTTRLSDRQPLAAVMDQDRYHELGNFMLAFVMLWAYMSVSQLLIIWSANLPEEIPWYVKRLEGPWAYLGGAVLVFHFAVPFLLLLWRVTKRHPKMLIRVAIGLMAMRFVELYWLIQPAFENGTSHFAWIWLDAGAWLAIGGLWISFFLRELAKRPLLPEHDPRFPEEFRLVLSRRQS